MLCYMFRKLKIYQR